MAKLDKLPVHVYEVDEEVDKDEVGLLAYGFKNRLSSQLDDLLENYQQVSKIGIRMFLETGEEFFLMSCLIEIMVSVSTGLHSIACSSGPCLFVLRWFSKARFGYIVKKIKIT